MRMLNEAIDVLQFPVLRLNEDSITRFASAKDLNRGTKKSFVTLREKPKDWIVDSQLKEFPVLEVVPIRRSWKLLFWPGPAPVYVLSTRVGEPKQLSFDEVKRKVIDLVVSKRWYRQGDESETEFRTAFEKFNTWEELVENLSLYGTLRF